MAGHLKLSSCLEVRRVSRNTFTTRLTAYRGRFLLCLYVAFLKQCSFAQRNADLTEDSTSGVQFALKKLRCPGTEQLRHVMQEIESSKRFRHKNCIRCLDSSFLTRHSRVAVLNKTNRLRYSGIGRIQDSISLSSILQTR